MQRANDGRFGKGIRRFGLIEREGKNADARTCARMEWNQRASSFSAGIRPQRSTTTSSSAS